MREGGSQEAAVAFSNDGLHGETSILSDRHGSVLRRVKGLVFLYQVGC